ncbi:MAG: hypothetical protein AB1640_15740 [bacterium]
MDEALGQYERLAASAPQTRIQRQQLFTLAKAGGEKEAIPLMEEHLRQDPTDFFMHNAYQGACRRAGELARSRGFYQEMVARFPKERSLYGRLRKIEKMLEIEE